MRVLLALKDKFPRTSYSYLYSIEFYFVIQWIFQNKCFILPWKILKEKSKFFDSVDLAKVTRGNTGQNGGRYPTLGA